MDHKNAVVRGIDRVHNGTAVRLNGRDPRAPLDAKLGAKLGAKFTFLYEHFGGRYKPWKVCVDPSTLKSKATPRDRKHHRQPLAGR